MTIAIPGLTAVGINVDELSQSPTSLIQAQYNLHEVLAAELQQNFQPTFLFVVHSDGKMLAHLNGTNRDSLLLLYLV